MSSRQSDGGGSRSMMVARLPAIDLIGASELFISWPMTRISRWNAWRSSSRSGWLRSDSTSSSCGRPPWRNELRRISQRPTPPGNAVLITRGASPSRQSSSPSSVGATAQQCARAICASSRAPARLTNFSSRSSSNVNTATSISAITLRSSVVASSASSRWWRSVSTSVLTSIITSPSAIAAARAARADGEVPLAERGEQVREGLEREDDALAQREREAEAEGDDDDGQRPLDLRRPVAGPEKDQRDERAGQRRRERHQQDPSVVA